MPGFEDAYAELFGERPTYDPIDTTPTRTPQPRVAIRAGLDLSSPGGMAEDSPFAKAYQELNSSAQPPPQEGGVEWADYGKQFGAGAVRLAGAVAGLPEYLARQGAGEGQTPYEQFFTDTAQTLSGPRRALGDVANRIQSTMTPEALDRAVREWTTLDPGRTIWRGGADEFISSLMLQATGATPSTLATLLPGALMMRAGLRNGAITYLGASEGALSVGSIANNIAEEIEQAPESELLEGSPRYAQLRQQYDESQAREILIGEAQGKTPAVAGFIVGLISAKAGRYLEPKLTDVGGGIMQRFGRGALSESIQESSQSGAEQIAQNFAAQTFDQSRPMFENVAEAAVQGGAIGGLMGGTINAAVGPRRQAMQPPPSGEPAPSTDPTQPEPVLPASFQEIFGEGSQQPQGTASFDDVFQDPNRPSARMSTLDQLQARERYVQNAAASTERQSLMSDALVAGHVDPALSAAMNARRDGLIDDMFAEQPNPMAGPAGEDMSQVWARNEQMDLQGGGMNPPPSTDVVPAGPPTQQPLFQERLRGVGRVPLQPMAAQPAVEDLSPPAGFGGAPTADMVARQEADAAAAQGRPTRADFLRQRAALMPQTGPTFRDTEQQDLFEAGPATPDQPSAEPVGDLVAQLEDLRDPDSPRKGVYLSAANLDNLRANGALEQVRGIGVPLANFDQQGGVLIAKDRRTAEELISLLGQGAGSMQEVLGYATGAGAGKPEGGNIAVQLRDENGNVIRESLVADEAEADELSQQWEAETGNETAIVSAPQAIRRREQRIRAENRQLEQGRETKRVGRATEQVIEQTLGDEGEVAEAAAKAVRGAESENVAARNLVKLARRQRTKERVRRWGDIEDPRSLEFEEPGQAEQYKELFMEHAGQQVLINTAKTESDKLKARARQNEIADQLRALRDIAKPTTRSQTIAAIARKVSEEEVTKIRRQSAEDAKRADEPEDHTVNVGEYTDEQVDVMDEPTLNKAFASAAKYISGRKRAQSTYEEVLAKHPSPSEKRKLVKRVQNFLQRRKYGGKVKTANLTRLAENKQGSDRPVRKSAFDTRVLSVEAVPRDQSKADKKALADRAKKAFRALDNSIANAASLITKTSKGDFSIIDNDRKPDGTRTDIARKLLLGRAYLRVLAEYGDALQKANNRASASAIKEVETFNDLIAKIKDYKPKEFAEQMSKLFFAEERESLTAAARSDPNQLAGVVYPAAREKMNQISAKRLAQLARVEFRLKDKNGFYENHVAPLMQKFIDSIATRGAMTYQPTLQELRNVQFAMRIWRGRADTRENYFEPVHRFFKDIGINFTTEKFGKDFKWETPDKLLIKRSRFGRTRKEASGIVGLPEREATTKEQEMREFARSIKLERKALARDVPFTPSEVERLARMKAYNTAVERLRERTKDRSTVLDLIRAEEEFLYTMRDNGLWQWVSESGGLGKYTTPGFARDITTTVRTVGARLRAHDIPKGEAIEMLRSSYPPIKMSSPGVAEESSSETAQLFREEFDARRDVEIELRELVRRDQMTPEQRRVLEALERQDSIQNLNLVVDEFMDSSEQVEEAARIIGSQLERADNFVNVQRLMEQASLTLPANNRFRVVFERLARVPGMGDVLVAYDRTGMVAGKNLAQYRVTKKPHTEFYVRTIVVNRPLLESLRQQGRDPHTLLLHALAHEATHAATTGAIENNPALKSTVKAIMQQSRRLMRNRGINTDNIYAFRDNDTHEFIAEAFSNGSFQKQLRETYIEPKLSIWQWIMGLVKKVLGLPDTPAYDNVLDAVMSLTDALFTGEERIRTKGGRDVQNLNIKDNGVRAAVANVLDRYGKSNSTWKSLWQQAKDRATSWLLPAMSMEQLRDTYSPYFQSGSNNPLADYMRSFFKRNADNSANMERADKLSRKWTELAEQDPDGVLEMSRIMTEATMHQMHPELSITDPDNAHLKQEGHKTKHAELAKRWRSLSEPMQDLYEDVQEFYDSTMRREVALMTLNALRGYLTKGSDAPLTDDEFDYTESDVEGLRLHTMEGLEEEFGGLIDKTGLKNIHRIASIPQQRKGPYFPLMRFGDFVVYAEREVNRKTFGSDRAAAREYRDQLLANDPTLDVSIRQASNGDWMAVITEKEFRAAETRSQAEAERMEMAAKYGEANTTPVQLKADLFSSEATIKSNAGLKTILSKLDSNPAAQAAIKNFYLQSLADKSFRKHELSRKNRRGVNYEQQHRTFASYAKQAAYYTSQLRFGWQMADALRDMQETVKKHRDESSISAVRMGEIVREINTRDKLTHNMQEVSKLARGGVEFSHFMLLTSPSYWLINATQPYMVTLPWLAARSSIGDATTALINAQKLIFSPLVQQAASSWGGLKALTSKAAAEKAFGVLEQVEDQIRKRAGDRAPEYLKMLSDLKRESIIDLSFIAELRDIASGKQSQWQNVLDASRIMAHLTEVNNRIMTAIAAYDVGRAKGMEEQSAIDFAKQATSLTQFNYSSGNKPRLFQSQGPLGSFGPLIFQFMQYPQHMYALLIQNMRAAMGDSPEGRKIARKTLAGIFATHLAAGGVIGMMLQPIKWAMGLAAFFFGDPDEPYDFDREVREITNELFGTELGSVVSSGLPRLAGMDFSQRMSLGTLYMVDLKTDNADSFMGSLMQTFGGPLMGLSAGAFNGVRSAMNGEWQKAFESIEPKVLKDISKAWRFSNEGMTDYTGKTFLDAKELSSQQLFLQYLGLNPADVSDAYVRRNAVREAKEHDRGRRDRLLQKFRRAETPEARQEVAVEVAEFNKHNPEMTITRSALIRSLTGAAESEARMQELGADLRGREVLYMDRDDFMGDEDEE
jgi:hypothetical protein